MHSLTIPPNRTVVVVVFLFCPFPFVSHLFNYLMKNKQATLCVSHRCFLVIIRPKQVLCCLALIIARVLFLYYYYYFIIIKGFSDVLAVAPVTLIKPQKCAFKGPERRVFCDFQVTSFDRFPFPLLWVSGAVPSRPRC